MASLGLRVCEEEEEGEIWSVMHIILLTSSLHLHPFKNSLWTTLEGVLIRNQQQH
jgi:hypothetical protein